MSRCEDYPCCGHGPLPHGGCPDAQGRFDCVECGGKLARGASSSLCQRCYVRVLEDERDPPDEREF